MTKTIYCKHYHSMMKPCSAGVEYKSVRLDRPGEPTTYPCWDSAVKTCLHALYPTAEEIAAEEKAANEHFENIMKARKLILDDAKGKWSGYGRSVECPVCGKRLSYSIASNGHVHARCETEHCLTWME